MRIITGSLGGRIFHQPNGHHTHPMSDKVRGALFNVLGDVEDLSILDAFAGSGAISFEAISRGAKSATALEKDPAVHKVILRNIEELGLRDRVMAVRANSSGWSNNNEQQQFDVVILAPPYDALQVTLLGMLASRHTKPSGILVLDWPGKKVTPSFDSFDQVAVKNYGDAQLVFYRKNR